jgi:hypothetical protein
MLTLIPILSHHFLLKTIDSCAEFGFMIPTEKKYSMRQKNLPGQEQ